MESRSASLHRLSITFVLILTATLAGACHKESPTCQALDTLKGSVQGLRDVNVVQDGVPALQKQLDTVDTDAQALKSAAGAEFGTEGTAFLTSLQDLKDAVQLAIQSPSTSNVAAAAGGVSVSLTDFSSLQTALPDCG